MEARSRKGISQARLAELTGISVTSINRIETGKQTPHFNNLSVIAQTLDVSVESIRDEPSADLSSPNVNLPPELDRALEQELWKMLDGIRKGYQTTPKEVIYAVRAVTEWTPQRIKLVVRLLQASDDQISAAVLKLAL